MTCLWTSTWVAARPMPGAGVHGLSHVGDELLQGLVEDGYGRGDFVEPGVGVAQDVQNGHLRTNSLAN